MKNLLKVFILFLTFFMLSSCNFFMPDEKEFSVNGMTINLTDQFVESSNVLAHIYLVSKDHIFMGIGEGKSNFSSQANMSLEYYTDLVIQNSGKPIEHNKYSDDETAFYYGYYTSEVEGISYSYMLVTMEGKTKYYTMNFGCYTSTFDDDVKEQYLEWAKTIRVE